MNRPSKQSTSRGNNNICANVNKVNANEYKIFFFSIKASQLSLITLKSGWIKNVQIEHIVP